MAAIPVATVAHDLTDDAIHKLLVGIGMDERRVIEALRNKSRKDHLVELIHEAELTHGCDRSVGLLIDTISSKYPRTALQHRRYVLNKVVDKSISTPEQLCAALTFIKAHAHAPIVDDAAFNRACGIGVIIRLADVPSLVSAFMDANATKTTLAAVMTAIRSSDGPLKWADAQALMTEVKAQLGTRTLVQSTTTSTTPTAVADIIRLPQPTENYQQHRPQLLAEHLAVTGGRIFTRFPPEPNGHLHFGHAKSMYLNFGYAKKHGGECYMRFDDTNPETEKAEYIDSILDNVAWLGHRPYRVTYSSQYFPQLYHFAVQLIRAGRAYVCHQSKAQMADGREHKVNSPWRSRPVEESLQLFEDMKNGKVDEGVATLRLAIDMTSDNPCLRDPIAYRIKFRSHPMTADTWCIYPSYDFTHPICDSLENITHSLCTLEFEVRRPLYNWILETLGLYRPPQIEFSRLNVTFTVLSKRKLITLVQDGHVSGWDDPRLPTLNGMRRRGYTPEAINDICERIGVTRNENHIEQSLIDECVRQDLDTRAPRGFAVLDPLLVTLTNVADGTNMIITVPNFPADKTRGYHQVSLTNRLYIDRSDFRDIDQPDFFGLAPGKLCGLKYAGIIRCTEVIRDSTGAVVELRAELCTEAAAEGDGRAMTAAPSMAFVKGRISWVSGQPHRVEIRLYDRLFTCASVGGDWLDALNPQSVRVCPHAMVDSSIVAAATATSTHFQFERIGFFVVDKDSTPDRLVFNKTVDLKRTFV